MSAKNFEIGDIVQATVDHIEGNKTLMKGSVGIVLGAAIGTTDYVAVRWDEKIVGGHDCGGRCEKGHGWNVYWKLLELAVPDNCEIEIEDDDLLSLFGGSL